MRTRVLCVSQADEPLPCPHEEIIKQNVISPEVMGGNAIMPEMSFVKILTVCHLPVLD